MGLYKKTINYISLILRLLFVFCSGSINFFERVRATLHFKKLLGRRDVEEMIECFEADKSIKSDRN